MKLKPIGAQRFCVLDDNDKMVLDVEFGERIWPLPNSVKIEIACDILETVERALKGAEKPVQLDLMAIDR